MSEKIDLTLILACFNEEPHLLENFKKILWILKNLKINFEVILIDDASFDDTAQVIKQISRQFTKDKILTMFHNANLGRGGTVVEGVRLARGDVVGFIDVDLEISENYIPAFLWKIQEGNEMVIARRSYEFTLQKWVRFLMTKVYAILVQLILKSPFRDTEAGYKFFNRKKILPVLDQTNDKKWFWDTEVVMRALDNGLKIAEVPVIFLRNAKKKSTVKVIPDTLLYLRNLIRFKRFFKKKP